MVGAARTSQGCHTCRSRKVKCDLAKPACQRCFTSGRLCGGYDRKVIFSNRTPHGLLAEDVPEDGDPVLDSEQKWIAGRSSAMPSQLNLTVVARRRIEGLFLEKYLSRSGNATWQSPGKYTQEAIELPRAWVLEPAVQALCMTRVGRFSGDDRLVHLGGQAYVLALRRLRIAMTKADIASTEGTFAAITLLSVHECYEPSSGNVRGFYEHTAGMARLMAMQGRGQQLSKAAKSLLEYARYSSMIDCLQGGKRSPLTSLKWQTTSLNNIVEFEQTLYDIGFEVAAFLEDLKSSSINVNSCQTLPDKVHSILVNLDSWYTGFLSWMPVPAFWTRNNFPHDNEEVVEHLDFPSLSAAHVFLEYWSLGIFLKIATGMLNQKMPLSRNNQDQLQNFPHIEFARNIERSIDYCRRPEMGYIGQHRMIFPIRIALLVYRASNQFATKEAKLTQIMAEISEHCGLRFANVVKRRPPSGSHAAVIEESSQYAGRISTSNAQSM